MNSLYESIWNTLLEEITRQGYGLSWHIARDLNLKTSEVNYILKKKVKDGLLHYVSVCYGTYYYPVDRVIDLPWSIKDIISTSDNRLKSKNI